VINQPLAALAKKEEILYVLGQESEPVALDRHSPVLHLVQMVRDEAHRFAVGFHRQRRGRELKEQRKAAVKKLRIQGLRSNVQGPRSKV
jgi:excinuclease ABC subunit C